MIQDKSHPSLALSSVKGPSHDVVVVESDVSVAAVEIIAEDPLQSVKLVLCYQTNFYYDSRLPENV